MTRTMKTALALILTTMIAFTAGYIPAGYAYSTERSAAAATNPAAEAAPAAKAASSTETTPPVSDSVADILAGMTLEQKITQCFMMDFRYWPDANGEQQDVRVLNDELAEIIADYQFGSIILFAPNLRQTDEAVALTRDIQKASVSRGGLPAMIAADQEGGIVYRLGSGTALPGNMALGATEDPANALIAGQIIGRELAAVGINTATAPVLDVNNNANNSVIGLRSFGDDTAMVGEMGSAFIRGVNEYNIIGCAKHFPGHGDTITDSHYGLPVVDKSLEELRANELKPFQIAIDQGIEMIMTAHILFPQVDDTTILSEKTGRQESRPATLSRKILTDLLRGEMGFDGLIVTDAMNMKGVSDNYSPEQAALEAIKAGTDMICMPVVIYNSKIKDSLDTIIAYIKQKAEADTEEGRALQARIDDAVTRILTLKKSKGILDYDPDAVPIETAITEALATVGGEENRRLEREISAKAVTMIRNENNALPYQADADAKVLMLCPYNNEKAQMVIGLNRAKAMGTIPNSVQVQVYRFSGDDYEIKEGGDLKKMIDWADLVVINSEISNISGMTQTSWISKGPAAYTEYCRAHGKTSVILSVDKPYDVQLYPDADAILAVYGCKGSSLDVTDALIDGTILADENACGPNITAGVEVLFGNFEATGRLPIDIPLFLSAKAEDGSVTGSFTDEIAYPRGYGLSFDCSMQSLTLKKTAFPWTGKKISAAPVVKAASGRTLQEGTHYKVTYTPSDRRSVGTYKVKVTGIGPCTGTLTASFRILPKGTSLSKPVRGKKSITVKWKKQSAKMSSSRITGYQIQLAADKSFTRNKKTVTVKGYSSNSKEIRNLRSGRSYYLRIRTFKTLKGQKYYSAWSKVKRVKTR